MLAKRYMRQMEDQLNDDVYVVKTATCTLAPHERLVEIDSTGGAMTVTLPPVAEMAGQIIVLYVVTYSGAITIASSDSGDFSAPTFNGAADGVVYFSDGRRWWELATRT